MFGSALASSINIGCAVEDTVGGRASTGLGRMDLNCDVMQDDIAKMNDNLEKARAGCVMLDNTLKRKQLSVNYDKSKFMLMGSKKFRADALEELKTNPMLMGGVTLEHAGKGEVSR